MPSFRHGGSKGSKKSSSAASASSSVSSHQQQAAAAAAAVNALTSAMMQTGLQPAGGGASAYHAYHSHSHGHSHGHAHSHSNGHHHHNHASHHHHNNSTNGNHHNFNLGHGGFDVILPASAAAAATASPSPPPVATPPATSGPGMVLNVDHTYLTMPHDDTTLAHFATMLLSPTATPATRLEALRGIRKLTCTDRSPPLQQVVDSPGVMGAVIAALDGDDLYAQFESAWILTNVASGSQKQARAVQPAVPRLVQMLAAEQEDLQEQACWALGNYSGSSCPMRDEVISLGTIHSLLPLLDPSQKLTILRVAAWCLSNLTRGKPPVDFEAVECVLPKLVQLLTHATDEAVLTDALWATSFLTDDTTPNSMKLDRVVQVPGLIPRIISFLRHPVFNIQSASLRCIGNVASGNDDHTSMLIEEDVLPGILALMVSPKKILRKEATWALSNISAGTQKHVEAIFDNGLIPVCVRMLENETFNIQKEAAWCVSNLTTHGTLPQLLLLTRPPLDVVPPLMELLTSNMASSASSTVTVTGVATTPASASGVIGTNHAINLVCLIAIQNLLRAAAKGNKQQQQQQHQPPSVKTSSTLPPSTPSPSPSPSPSLPPSSSNNPVIHQVYSVGGPSVIAALRHHPSSDVHTSRIADEILKEFFTEFKHPNPLPTQHGSIEDAPDSSNGATTARMSQLIVKNEFDEPTE